LHRAAEDVFTSGVTDGIACPTAYAARQEVSVIMRFASLGISALLAIAACANGIVDDPALYGEPPPGAAAQDAAGPSQPGSGGGGQHAADSGGGGTEHSDAGGGGVHDGAPLDTGSSVVDVGQPDTSQPAQSGCAGYASPNSNAACHACSGGSCQPNGCYGGYWCDTSTNHCHASPPAGCDAG
jgi:hypothetical protein